MVRLIASLYARIRHLVPELAKFGIVGSIGAVIDLGGAAVLHSAYHQGPLKAKAISIAAATIVTYIGSRYWTFRHRENQPLLREGALFVVLNLIGLVIAELVIAFTTYVLGFKDPIAYNLASLVGTGLGTIFRYFAYRKWVFLAPAAQPAPAMEPGLEPAYAGVPSRAFAPLPARHSARSAQVTADFNQVPPWLDQPNPHHPQPASWPDQPPWSDQPAAWSDQAAAWPDQPTSWPGQAAASSDQAVAWPDQPPWSDQPSRSDQATSWPDQPPWSDQPIGRPGQAAESWPPQSTVQATQAPPLSWQATAPPRQTAAQATKAPPRSSSGRHRKSRSA